MPARDLDDMLAQLEAEETGEGTDADDTGQPKESSTMKQLRAEIKRRDAALKKAEARNAELEEKEAARLQADNVNALKSAGLTPKQAEAFLRLYDAATIENIESFKADVLAVDGVYRQQQSDAAPGQEFVPSGSIGDSAGGQKFLSRQEFEELFARDQEAAQRAFAEGRVRLTYKHPQPLI